ncbi:MAG TPA: FliA/WhiG family RNA polymerase sigma factor [Clostridiaceae bacterium]|nr:FliA/WhiG family RNA polymerase sigma factor [Clostridiaceae bacterium]
MLNSYELKSETREEKIIKYLPLVKMIAGRIFFSKSSPVDTEDLVSFGIIGLIDAVDRFDPSKGVKFETYASLRIKGSIIDEIRKLSWIPRTAMAKISKLNEVRDDLKAKLAREPKDEEIAKELDITVEQMRKMENYVNYMSIISLDEVIFQSDDDELFLYSTIEDNNSLKPDKLLEKKEAEGILKEAIEMLDDKDKLVLSLYYSERLTLKEIGSVLKVSESRVCQIHSRAILRLRENLKKLKY